MYDCSITANRFIATVQEETDISAVIPQESWLRWINAVEQFLYTEVIAEYAAREIAVEGAEIPLSAIGAEVTYDDIIRVYGDDVELDRAGVITASVPSDYPIYYTDYSGNLCIRMDYEPSVLRVVYRIRPSVKVTGEEHVALPVEWLDMLAARLRAEAYKIANTDDQAGKWMQDYNVQLESFKIWATKRNERYGE